MSYSVSSPELDFYVHPNVAPTPQEALEGSQIVNDHENIGLSLLPDQGNTRVVLDTSVEPPVLRLRHALANCALGHDGLDENGTLIPQPTDYPRARQQWVSGTYTGAGSVLKVVQA